MSRLLTAFALLLVAGTAVSAGHIAMSPAEFPMWRLTKTCTSAGQYICSAACDQVLLCVSNGDEGFESIMLEQCPDNYRCSPVDHTCVNGPTACSSSPDGTIVCHGTGLYPDPYNCTMYHICAGQNTQSLPRVCGNSWAWNPATSDCSKQLTDDACINGPVDTCLTVGQTGTVDGNPSIYYICINRDGSLIPDLHKCPHGEEYNPAQYACIDSPTLPSTVTTSSPTPPPTQPTTTPDPSRPIAGEPCPVALQKVPDPDDCTRYYKCSLEHIWLNVACPLHFYFNPARLLCKLGSC